MIRKALLLGLQISIFLGVVGSAPVLGDDTAESVPLPSGKYLAGCFVYNTDGKQICTFDGKTLHCPICYKGNESNSGDQVSEHDFQPATIDVSTCNGAGITNSGGNLKCSSTATLESPETTFCDVLERACRTEYCQSKFPHDSRKLGECRDSCEKRLNPTQNQRSCKNSSALESLASATDIYAAYKNYIDYLVNSYQCWEKCGVFSKDCLAYENTGDLSKLPPQCRGINPFENKQG